MKLLLLILAIDAESAAQARWLRGVMTSWPTQLLILLLFTGLALLLVRHAAREWEGGIHNRYLQVGLVAGGAFFILQFLFTSSLVGGVTWPEWLFLIEFVVVFALWLYGFVRFMTRQRRGRGDDESRARGAALDRVIKSA